MTAERQQILRGPSGGLGGMTWFQASADLKDGDRVVFTNQWDIFPECIVAEGEQATVVENSLNEMQPVLIVLPDSANLREVLANWDGQIHLYPEAAYNHEDKDSWQDEAPIATVVRA